MKIQNSNLVITEELIDYLADKYTKSENLKSTFTTFQSFYEIYVDSLNSFLKNRNLSAESFLKVVEDM